MSMQTDVLSAHRTTDGELVAYRTRVKSIVVATSATAGSVVLKDGGVSGAALVTITTAADAGLSSVLIPGEGVLFRTNVYLDLENVDGVTVFYG